MLKPLLLPALALALLSGCTSTVPLVAKTGKGERFLGTISNRGAIKAVSGAGVQLTGTHGGWILLTTPSFTPQLGQCQFLPIADILTEPVTLRLSDGRTAQITLVVNGRAVGMGLGKMSDGSEIKLHTGEAKDAGLRFDW